MIVLGTVKLLLLPSVIHFAVSGISVENVVRVIVALLGELRSAGVYLLVSPEQATGGCWNSTVGLLSKYYTPTAVINLERAIVSQFQSDRPSVYVIQSAGMKGKPPLRKVRSFSWRQFLENQYELRKIFRRILRKLINYGIIVGMFLETHKHKILRGFYFLKIFDKNISKLKYKLSC